MRKRNKANSPIIVVNRDTLLDEQVKQFKFQIVRLPIFNAICSIFIVMLSAILFVFSEEKVMAIAILAIIPATIFLRISTNKGGGKVRVKELTVEAEGDSELKKSIKKAWRRIMILSIFSATTSLLVMCIALFFLIATNSWVIPIIAAGLVTVLFIIDKLLSKKWVQEIRKLRDIEEAESVDEKLSEQVSLNE